MTISVRTVGELLEKLRGVDPSIRVLTVGYEGGMVPAVLSMVRAQELDRHGKQSYLGAYEPIDEAARQAALDADDPELAAGRLRPPDLVGEPFTAVVLGRRGTL